jgi:hypothetical protein
MMAQKIGTSNWHWFARGMGSGIMLIAAANAVSYFFRSRNLEALFGSKAANNGEEALGFPLEIWRSGENYNGWMLDYSTLPWNLLTGVLLGCFFGLIGLLGKPMFNQWVADFESQQSPSRKLRLQFSVKGLLILTTVIAVVFAATNAWGTSPQLLGAIYFIGPLCLILIAMAPDHFSWQYRVAILVPVAMALIGVAIATGTKLGMNIDQVLLGIFISWTPQSAFMALLIIMGMMVRGIFQLDRVPPLENETTTCSAGDNIALELRVNDPGEIES